MIYIRSLKEVEKITESNRIVAETLALLGKEIKPGISTLALDKLAEEYIRSQDAQPAFKGYNGFPASICASIDEQVVHGIPSQRELHDGEIIGIDVGALKNGYYGDAAFTFAVGQVDETRQRLMRVTEDSLYKGIEKARAGNHLSDIGHMIQTYVESHGFSVVRSLVGHGIGTQLHEAPEVPNYGDPGRGPELKPGMCLAIEPMVNVGTFEVESLEDGWTIVTVDRKPSAHFEHTIAITENNPLILSTREVR
ncbi:type I methionyl aminopeptidase [bacterium]|nr:type I methionyl aminopeptidase [bacterium]MBU1063307.1 type I methionyl aminopeptidase [bacterium]MBU1634788.1 type I methionyl aminopeptidase [bacterium]MBU1874043.1 type I methionyl aminopeptidase [bacterium]